MNLLHFIRLFHLVSIVNPERVNRFERQAEKICHEMKGVIDLQHFQFALNSLLAILEDAHTYFMPEDGLIYPYEIRVSIQQTPYFPLWKFFLVLREFKT